MKIWVSQNAFSASFQTGILITVFIRNKVEIRYVLYYLDVNRCDVQELII